jgi:hypothetical protein
MKTAKVTKFLPFLHKKMQKIDFLLDERRKLR